jgi:hypothetical protein
MNKKIVPPGYMQARQYLFWEQVLLPDEFAIIQQKRLF